MSKMYINKYWISISMIIFSTISILLIFKIYNLTLQDAKTTHQMEQMQMAKSVVQGIKYYIDHLTGDIKLLVDQMKSANRNSDEINSKLKSFLNHYKEDIVKSIFVADKSGNVLYLEGDSLPDRLKTELTKFNDSGRKVYYSNVTPFKEDFKNENLYFLIFVSDIAKLKPYKNPNQSESNDLVYVYLVSFNNLMKQFINQLKLGEGDFAWVLDGEGRLLFHPRHKKMVLRSITQTSSECSVCHSSFEMQKRIIHGNASVDEYSIGNEPPKIMAYVPLNFLDKRWVVVISTFLPDVTSNLREKFQYFFILGFVILCGFIAFGVLLHYINLKRIRAEEANKNLEHIQEYQEQLNQASKMASIGELIDTVAHEINTPIGIISANADAVLLQNKHLELNEELHIIKRQTRRISEYVKRLLNYSQRMPFHPEPTNIEDLINECTFLLGHRFRDKKISVTKKIPANLNPALADRRQMEQVFINLLNNAIDALQSNGEIVLEAWNVNNQNDTQKNGNSKGICFSINDNGTGILDENLDKIFNPFYSTKSSSRGTGLGLYIAKSIVQRHKGTIKVSSTINGGTKFKIFLPSVNTGDKSEQ